MLTKIHYQDDQESLFEKCGGHMVELYESGDMIKQAASAVFSRSELAALAPPPGHFMAHVIGMGSEEGYGFNRNGDGFPKEALAKYHPTFVSHGHLFREHRNRDAKTQGLGLLKAAKFNEPMQRVEIVLHAEIDKCEKEFEKAASGKPLSVSMSCRVPVDRCNICNNESASVEAYCDHARYKMSRYVTGHKKYAFVHNDRPTFFDLSFVERPADRIAHYLEYRFGKEEGMRKAASASDLVITGADWAEYEGVSLPGDNQELYPLDPDQMQALTKLAAEEAWLEGLAKAAAAGEVSIMSGAKQAFALTILDKAFCKEASTDAPTIDLLRSVYPGTLFRGLAKRAVVLPYSVFHAYVTGEDPDPQSPMVKAAMSGLPTIFRDLLSSVSGVGCCSPMADQFQACSQTAADFDEHQTDPVAVAMDRMTEDFGAGLRPAKQRSMNPYTREDGHDLDKEASISVEPDQTLLHSYAMYKVNALCDMVKLAENVDTDKLPLILAGQNRTINI